MVFFGGAGECCLWSNDDLHEYWLGETTSYPGHGFELGASFHGCTKLVLLCAELLHELLPVACILSSYVDSGPVADLSQALLLCGVPDAPVY